MKNEYLEKNYKEIDIFENLYVLWENKWAIIIFIFLTLLLASLYLYTKEPVYESKIKYNIETTPPFHNDQRVALDFKQMFYLEKNFENWKNNQDNTLIDFSDFSSTEVKQGIEFSKEETHQLAAMKNSYILLRSNNLELINDFYQYSKHINKQLKIDYLDQTNDELKFIKTLFKDVSYQSNFIIEKILSNERYIFTSNQGANALSIQPPTMPKKVSPNTFLTLIFSAIIGSIIGVLFLVVRYAIITRKIKT